MASHRFLAVFLLMIPILLLGSSHATAKELLVGGKDGWVLKPSQDYDHWAQKNRFQVNDTLRFKYNKESDSVLVVKKEEYHSCYTNNPKQKMDDGDSVFKLSESGLFYFISGNVDHCKHGQKLIVLVMSVRHHPVAPFLPATPVPSPSKHFPSTPLLSPAPSPAKSSSASSVDVGLGFRGVLGVWVILILSGFVGLA